MVRDAADVPVPAVTIQFTGRQAWLGSSLPMMELSADRAVVTTDSLGLFRERIYSPMSGGASDLRLVVVARVP